MKMEKDINRIIEAVKAGRGRQALSDDALEQVVGGAFEVLGDGYCVADGNKMTYNEFNAVVMGVNDQLGIGIAMGFLKSVTGFSCSEMDERWLDQTPDKAYLARIMKRFWQSHNVSF